MSDEKIHNRYEMRLTMGADTFDTLLNHLSNLDFKLRNRPEGFVHVGQDLTQNVRITSGGYDCGYTIDIDFDPEMTGDKHRAALLAWRDEKKAEAEEQQP